MILVTGAAGYIGSHTLHRINELGIPVVAIDNLSSGHRWAVPAGIPFYEGDVGDKSLVSEIIEKHKVESVIHFAAHLAVEESVYNPLKYYKNNVIGTLNLIDCCDRLKVKNFIFSSSCSVYGNASKSPISEDMRTEPMSPYAQSKLMSETFLRDLEKSGRSIMKSVCLRYFNVAGAKVTGELGQSTPQATQLVKVASEVAVGKRDRLYVFGTDYPTPDGTCMRDYIHVDDLVEAHVQALQYLQKGGSSEIFNCGYGVGYSVSEVITSMKKVSGVDFVVEYKPRRAGDPIAVWANCSKITKVLSWKPKFNNLDLICKTSFDWEKKLNSLDWKKQISGIKSID